ncbi:MAG: DUF1553 domain-containing protein [Planctomycetota bacterium]
MEQAEQLAGLEARRATLEAELEQIDLSDSQRRWEESQHDAARAWRMWRPEGEAESGARLVTGDDGSVMVSGAAPEQDLYRLSGTIDGALTALRLEALTDPSLPRNGPGRSAGNGNFVLNEIRVHAIPARSRPITGLRVRIDLPGTGRILSLAEVQVIAGDRNVALEGTATQSSTGYDGPARLAIDGITDGDFFGSRSVTHNQQEDDPWWQVDLGESRPIDRIVIWNRTDGNIQNRLDSARVSIVSESGQVVWQQTIEKAPENDRLLDVAGSGRELPIASASASFSQKDWTIEKAIDGRVDNRYGWAISPRQGQPHEAVLRFATPQHIATGERLQVTLVQSYGGAHTLGHFRLSWTSLAQPPRAVAADVTAAIETPKAERSDVQEQLLRETYRSFAPEIASLRSQISEVDAKIRSLDIATTPVMEELPAGEHRDSHVLIKGNFLQTGDPVTASVPEAFHDWPEGAPHDRLGLAQWLISRENPLTARVCANRYWAKLFGQGLVLTEEDFGSQGTPPTHPELLDWLALELINRGWDVKALLRTIVTSSTYRQSSHIREELLERDPQNRLYARGPRHRLEAEMVRDQALALSGLLSRKMLGPSVFPPQPAGLWQAAFNGERDWRTSEGEDRYRRGVYVFWRRTVPYPSMEVFDAPSRETCTLRRIRTATPLQAFVTLNDPVYVEAAQALARRILKEGGASDVDRARWALTLCLGRPPSDAQVDVLARRVREERTHFASHPGDAKKLATEPLGELPEDIDVVSAAAWTVGANILLNLDHVLTKS